MYGRVQQSCKLEQTNCWKTSDLTLISQFTHFPLFLFFIRFAFVYAFYSVVWILISSLTQFPTRKICSVAVMICLLAINKRNAQTPQLSLCVGNDPNQCVCNTAEQFVLRQCHLRYGQEMLQIYICYICMWISNFLCVRV